MDKDSIYTMEHYSVTEKNEIMPLPATWMDSEIIILSKICQKKTNTILYHLYVESEVRYKSVCMCVRAHVCVCVYNRHFAVQKKLIHCKSTVLQ